MRNLGLPNRLIRFWVLGAIACSVITSCQELQSTPQSSEQTSLVPMTTDEILEAITGNSEVWPVHGAGYYRADGTFLGVWDGQEAEGTWWVENHVRCYDVAEWGGEWCHEFYRRGEEIVLVRQGTDSILPNRIEPGNKL